VLKKATSSTVTVFKSSSSSSKTLKKDVTGSNGTSGLPIMLCTMSIRTKGKETVNFWRIRVAPRNAFLMRKYSHLLTSSDHTSEKATKLVSGGADDGFAVV
jgi:hypothetical protein